MNTLITVIPKLAPIIYDVIERDNNHEYGLKYNVDYGIVRTTHFKAFDYIDDVLVVEKVDEERSHWWIKSFEPGRGLWDGTSLLPDKGKISFLNFDALFKASLFHDVVYKRAEELSKATGIPVEKLLAFADDMLKILADGYGASEKMTTPVHWLVRTGGSLYHKIKKILAVGLVLLMSGCYSIQTEIESPVPEIHWTGPFSFDTTNKLDTTANLPGHSQNDSAPTNEYISIPSVPNQPVTPEVPPIAFQIESFGSPNCSKAKEVSEAQIKDLKISKNGLTYRWATGGCEKFGASSASDYSQTLAVAGYGDGKTFKAAKFDWISTSRTSRSFENIYDHYNGFDPDKFFSAKHRCFFIMSKEGKRRTNVLVD